MFGINSSFWIKSLVVASLVLFFPIGFFGMMTFGTHNSRNNFENNGIRVGMVLGAGVREDGQPGLILKYRLDKAVELWKNGNINRILVSGDNRELNYNEPVAMQGYLIDKGVEASSIVLDYAGRSTFDSCWRARNVFGINKLVVITQAFHLPRTVYLCRELGIETWPVAAIDANPGSTRYGIGREIPAAWAAVWAILNKQSAEVGSDGKEIKLN